jgi:Skp family chaperone for outer membrane proteins
MCVRTKTSYDCGHTFKKDESCNHPSCPGLERYHFKSEGDCRQCKKDGEAVSRGREGQGRYARELYKKEHRPAPIHIPSSSTSQSSQINPWAPPSKREKVSRGPFRKQADEAWEEEHKRRQEDLQARIASSRGGDVTYTELVQPRRERQGRDGRDDRAASIRDQVQRMEDEQRLQARRRKERQASYDSFDSLGESYRSHGSGHHSCGHPSHGQYGSEGRSPESGRSRQYDSGFGAAKHNPCNLYNTESYFSGLGQGLGALVKDSGWRWARWY